MLQEIGIFEALNTYIIWKRVWDYQIKIIKLLKNTKIAFQHKKPLPKDSFR